jgi:two-component system OmpR family response regulator
LHADDKGVRPALTRTCLAGYRAITRLFYEPEPVNMPDEPLQRILYVEDDPDIQAIARVALEAVGGFTVEIYDNGKSAIAAAASFMPELMLIDVMMPDMDGPTTLAALRDQPALTDTPAVFITAKVQPDEIEKLQNHGAVDIITKPFDPMTLSDKLRRIWAALP